MYEALNSDVLARIPRSSRRVLDVGCGTGSLGERLGARQERRVVGVTRDLAEARSALRRLDAVIVADLDRGLALSGSPATPAFDAVVLSHVLEHLREPRAILLAVRKLLGPDGAVVVAVPNALHWRVRWQLARGRFRYTDGGTLDRTHLRFFDLAGARDLLPSCGFRLGRLDACGHLPGSRWLGRWLGTRVDRVAMRWLPGLLAWQFVLVGTPAGAPDGAHEGAS